jgi:outer membrane biosynthesis protein TonB
VTARRRSSLVPADGGPVLLGRLALGASTAALLVAVLALVATDAVRGEPTPVGETTTVRELPTLPGQPLELEGSDAIPALRTESERRSSRRPQRSRTPARERSSPAAAPRAAAPRPPAPTADPAPPAANSPAPAPAAAPAPAPPAPAPRAQPAPQPAAKPAPQPPPVLFDDQG